MDILKDSKKLIDDNMDKIKIIYPHIVDVKYYRIENNSPTCRVYFSVGTPKHTRVSRLVFESILGRVLSFNETVDHIDGNPLNNSIENLQLLSRSENSSKGPSDLVKIRLTKENSISQSENLNIKGERSNLHKLTESEVLEIRASTEKSNKKLAVKYNVTRGAIFQIRHRLTWKHI